MTTLLVTRPAGQSAELIALLAERGIRGIGVPTVEIVPSPPGGELERALLSLDGVAWLVITSSNGAAAVARRMAGLGCALPANTRVAAVGPATAAALERRGIRVDHVPPAYRTVAIVKGLGRVGGQRIVLARADAATPDLRNALIAGGATVEEVVAYRTVEGPPGSRGPVQAALDDHLDGITFTSGTTVRGLCRLVSAADKERAEKLPAYCIGPVTARVAREAGFDVPVVAAEHTVAALSAAIEKHLREERP
jgi:uroporphyrinogen III methyltransferase/synthase